MATALRTCQGWKRHQRMDGSWPAWVMHATGGRCIPGRTRHRLTGSVQDFPGVAGERNCVVLPCRMANSQVGKTITIRQAKTKRKSEWQSGLLSVCFHREISTAERCSAPIHSGHFPDSRGSALGPPLSPGLRAPRSCRRLLHCYTLALANLPLNFTFDHVHPILQAEPGAILHLA
jgi:hypothetical protein